LTEHENLELARNSFDGKQLGGAKVPSACIIDQNVEMTGSSKCRIEGTLDRNSVGQIETDRMQSWGFWDSL
jgi:hypothetical protein